MRRTGGPHARDDERVWVPRSAIYVETDSASGEAGGTGPSTVSIDLLNRVKSLCAEASRITLCSKIELRGAGERCEAIRTESKCRLDGDLQDLCMRLRE